MTRIFCLLTVICVSLGNQPVVLGQETEAEATGGANKKPDSNTRQNAYPPTIEGAKVEVYKQIDGVELKAYILDNAEASTKPRPAIVFFFGGGWRSGSPVQFEQHCKYFAERGMVAMTVDYRVASRQNVKAVACVADAKSAIRWVRKNASELGVDPDRIVAAGGSAGGHLAAATATIKKFDEATEDSSVSSVPNALALFNPALVLAPVDGETKIDNQKIAELEERMGVAARELSPYHHIDASVPPTIIFHGKADRTVPYRTAELFTESMHQAGGKCRLVGFEDATHGFFNFGRDGNESYRSTIKALDEFLVELEFIEPKS